MKKARLRENEKNFQQEQIKTLQEGPNFFDVLQTRIPVGQKTQIHLNNHFFMKFYYSHSIIVVMLTTQFVMFIFLKVTELMHYHYFESKDDPTYKLSDPEVIKKKHKRLHIISHAMDLALIVQYFILNYHKIIYQ